MKRNIATTIFLTLNYGLRELEELARRPGETEKDQTIRELAQQAIDAQDHNYNDYNSSYDPYPEATEPSYPAKGEIIVKLRAFPVWPANKVVPDRVYEVVPDSSSYEGICSRFLVADFDQAGKDDIMFLDSDNGYWTAPSLMTANT